MSRQKERPTTPALLAIATAAVISGREDPIRCPGHGKRRCDGDHASLGECWACGGERPLERAHVVPFSVGGTSRPEDFALLCHRCHLDAPNVSDPELFWGWVHRREAETDVFVRELHGIGVEQLPTAVVEAWSALPVDEQDALIEQLTAKTVAGLGTHAGTSPATVAAAVVQILGQARTALDPATAKATT